MLKSTSDSYYEASLERLGFAQQLFDDSKYPDRYYAAHLFSGLAVECMLHAYQLKHSATFEARHDIERLARESKFDRLVPKSERETYSAIFATMNKRWRSNHRYFTRRDVERYLQA